MVTTRHILPLLAAAAAAAALTLAVPAVSSAADGDDARPSFSHVFHLGDGGAECGNCHDTKSQPGLPTLKREDGCTECHDAAPDYQYTAARARRLNVALPHRTHTDVAECVACHKPTATETQVSGKPVLERSRCLSCHDENGVSIAESACKSCHGKPMQQVAPASHSATWRTRHGEAASWQREGEHGGSCNMCHQQRTCDTCHHVTKPLSHTGLWRLRTHGSDAAWDSTPCKTCHETGTCVRCHQTTAPLNHQAAWQALHQLVAESRSDASCAACHSTRWCATCHDSQQSPGAP